MIAQSLPPKIETLSWDLNAGATMQSNPSREIYIIRAHTTAQFIPTMATHILSGMNMLRILPGLCVL